MNDSLYDIFSSLQLDKDGIYNSSFHNTDQSKEIDLREENAIIRRDKNFLDFIPKHHSIPVMDTEVCRALSMVNANSIILDVGGGIGWHWRHLRRYKPEVSVIILDFIRGNLLRAKELLKEMQY